MPCTTILVGKNATYDGSTMMARNEDSPGGQFCAKKFIVVKPEEQPREYQSVISKVKITLPDNPMRYTAMPNALPDEGIWGEAGINECNVAMSETETLTSNPRVLGADPLVEGGIGEEDMLTIVLPYIHSAREGVQRLGALLEEYGTYEMNGIGFQDVDEVWWLESVGGHHWIAKRVPDDAYVVMPNQLGIDSFDFKDAFGSQKDHMCSADLIEFIENNFLDCTMGGVTGVAFADGNVAPRRDLLQVTDFDVRAAFGSHSDSDHVYNTPRAWYMERYLNPNTYKWDGSDADFGPESDDLPWSMAPEHKLTVEDIKYVLSAYYQGTDYNPYSRHADEKLRGMYRPIGINRNNFVAVTQLRPYLPQEIMAVEWIAEGSNAFNELVPFYANVNKTPAYLADTTAQVTTENFYWANRIVGALTDAHFANCIVHVERYQLKLMSLGHGMLSSYEKEYLDKRDTKEKIVDVSAYLEQCNEEIAACAKKETYALLDKVLYSASNEMKNAFSRSDA